MIFTEPSNDVPSREAGEGGGHFFGGVGVAGATRGRDSGSEGLPRFGVPRESHIKLAELEISGDVIGMRAQQDVEMLDSGIGIAGIGALERERVKSEWIVRLRGGELLEFLAASFCWLWLGHRVRGSIIGWLIADANW
jgi:hypothetical protein